MPATKVMWQPWAHNQAFSSGFFVFTAGLISLYYPNLYLAIGNIVIGLIIMAWEKPLPPFKKLDNFWLRGIIYFLFCGAMVWEAPHQTAGLCLLSSSITYIRAAINGEKWTDPTKKPARGGGGGGKGGAGGAAGGAAKAPKS
ncbi:hypothetical protein DFJ73DRAFT_758177 [Zopfochytrium polystomum]|nr:hypothetical protein DFJ73DRAFT_758177 [Zopfochytrium polystomum]